jgi:hypothetical protein
MFNRNLSRLNLDRKEWEWRWLSGSMFYLDYSVMSQQYYAVRVLVSRPPKGTNFTKTGTRMIEPMLSEL